jgi:hypothetical protein
MDKGMVFVIMLTNYVCGIIRLKKPKRLFKLATLSFLSESEPFCIDSNLDQKQLDPRHKVAQGLVSDDGLKRERERERERKY